MSVGRMAASVIRFQSAPLPLFDHRSPLFVPLLGSALMLISPIHIRG